MNFIYLKNFMIQGLKIRRDRFQIGFGRKKNNNLPSQCILIQYE
jgi:hypothetical protein